MRFLKTNRLDKIVSIDTNGITKELTPTIKQYNEFRTHIAFQHGDSICLISSTRLKKKAPLNVEAHFYDLNLKPIGFPLRLAEFKHANSALVSMKISENGKFMSLDLKGWMSTGRCSGSRLMILDNDWMILESVKNRNGREDFEDGGPNYIELMKLSEPERKSIAKRRNVESGFTLLDIDNHGNCYYDDRGKTDYFARQLVVYRKSYKQKMVDSAVIKIRLSDDIARIFKVFTNDASDTVQYFGGKASLVTKEEEIMFGQLNFKESTGSVHFLEHTELINKTHKLSLHSSSIKLQGIMEEKGNYTLVYGQLTSKQPGDLFVLRIKENQFLSSERIHRAKQEPSRLSKRTNVFCLIVNQEDSQFLLYQPTLNKPQVDMVDLSKDKNIQKEHVFDLPKKDQRIFPLVYRKLTGQNTIQLMLVEDGTKFSLHKLEYELE